jgi:hypothetical protein
MVKYPTTQILSGRVFPDPMGDYSGGMPVKVGCIYPSFCDKATLCRQPAFAVYLFDVYFLLVMEDEIISLKNNLIGVLKENQLHASLKKWYSKPGDLLEVAVDGYIIDILRDGLLIEIQTRSFSNIKKKLLVLTEKHPVRLVLPVSKEKWIIKKDSEGRLHKRRKSPQKGRFENIFYEMVRIPQIAARPNFSFEALLIQEEEIQIYDGKGSWRRKGWSIKDRHLLTVLDSKEFTCTRDYLSLLPPNLPSPFTVRDLATASGIPADLAQKTTYCLRQMGALRLTGKRGRAYLYERDTQ